MFCTECNSDSEILLSRAFEAEIKVLDVERQKNMAEKVVRSISRTLKRADMPGRCAIDIAEILDDYYTETK